MKQITNLLFEARATLANVDWPRIELLLVPGRYELKFIPPPADGFASRTITSVLVSTDTLVIIDFCPIYLPIILKDR